MSLFISHFRSWIFAAALFVVLEATVWLVAHPNWFDRTNFLEFSFAHDETPQRLFVLEKIKAFASSSPTIVQSGDSSGFYGIDPRIVTAHLPAGQSFINMSCCANLGFRGYYNLLDLMASQNGSVRYLILHFTPYTMPRPEMWESDGAALWGVPDVKVFGDAVYQDFMSPWRALLHVPSLAFRRQVTDRIYYLNGTFNRLDRPLLNNENYLEFLRIFRDTKGWMPETDVRQVLPATECEVSTPTFFDVRTMASKTYLEDVLESYARLAKRHDATLVVVFQPVACTLGTGRGSDTARKVVARFTQNHPDVEVPFPLIETWPADMFSVPAHVRHEYTDRLGNRLGEAMAEIVRRRGS
ncbi:hypothetical protein [Bradyrhizobium sp. WD16]|uniref:hypothetical protein n=1 Tax=Bradyrhizobium sp. WD16 TaxID=1521768 RepID=UPI0020A268F5|nr:hypothetical protein [Bradyrhizobium sp. WD16]